MKRFPVLSLCLVVSGLAAASAFLWTAPAEAQTLNNAFGGLSENSNEPIDIKSDVLTVYTDDYALFSGNVKAVQGTTTLRARELKVQFRGDGNSNGADAEAAKQPAAGRGVVAPTTAGSPRPDTRKADGNAPVSSSKPPAEEAVRVVSPTTASRSGSVAQKADGNAPASSAKSSAEAVSEDKTQRTIEDPIDIESDWLLIHDEEKYAHFKGNVRVVRGETKLRSEELKVNYSGGDSLSATTESTAGTPAQITKIEARGSVHALLTPGQAKDTETAKRPAKTAPEAAAAQALTPGGGKPQAAPAGTKVANARPQRATSSTGALGGAAPNSRALGTNNGPAVSQDTPPATSKGREIARLEATGDVVITSEKEETSTSDWAIYNLPSQLVTIGGNVVLSQGQSVLKGDRLIIDLKTGESRFENTGTAASGGGRIRALFMPKEGNGPAKAGRKKPASGGQEKQRPENAGAPADNGEPLPIVPEYR